MAALSPGRAERALMLLRMLCAVVAWYKRHSQLEQAATVWHQPCVDRLSDAKSTKMKQLTGIYHSTLQTKHENGKTKQLV
jgi:hypothetical protein